MSKTIFVVGARHLGRAIALHFASQQHNIAVMARTKEDVDSLCQEIEAKGSKSLAIVGDLRSREETTRAVLEANSQFGPLDLGVNAITPGARFGFRPFLELEDSDLDLGLESSVRGAFRFLQILGGHMAKENGGTLVQIGTSSSLRIREGFGAMASIHHALRALTIAAAKEFRSYKVHVAHLPCDGGIESAKTQNYVAKVGKEKTLSQEEIARAVEFLFQQSPRAWSHELILRPIEGNWTALV